MKGKKEIEILSLGTVMYARVPIFQMSTARQFRKAAALLRAGQRGPLAVKLLKRAAASAGGGGEVAGSGRAAGGREGTRRRGGLWMMSGPHARATPLPTST